VVGLNKSLLTGDARLVVVDMTVVSCRAFLSSGGGTLKIPDALSCDDASIATPGQAGLPAEFKHINKRRKRNLQGFP
jgi:hypothetical protein